MDRMMTRHPLSALWGDLFRQSDLGQAARVRSGLRIHRSRNMDLPGRGARWLA